MRFLKTFCKKQKQKVVEAYQGGQGYKQFLSLYGSSEMAILPELFQDYGIKLSMK